MSRPAGMVAQTNIAQRFRMSGRLDFILRANAEYIEEQYRRWLENPFGTPPLVPLAEQLSLDLS